MTPVLLRLRVEPLSLEPTAYPARRVAHYDPSVVDGVYLSATPVEGVSGDFEFQIDAVPNDDHGSAGIFVQNNTFFDFDRLPLSSGQHYGITVFYSYETEEGEIYSEDIFYVDAYPDG